jgi:hypothetical protein
VVRLRGYGNAIVPQTAAMFIRAYLDTEHPQPVNTTPALVESHA